VVLLQAVVLVEFLITDHAKLAEMAVAEMVALAPMAYPLDLMQTHQLDQAAAVVVMDSLTMAQEAAETAQAVLLL
jgi:flagellar basal body-associated protein FliL